MIGILLFAYLLIAWGVITLSYNLYNMATINKRWKNRMMKSKNENH